MSFGPSRPHWLEAALQRGEGPAVSDDLRGPGRGLGAVVLGLGLTVGLAGFAGTSASQVDADAHLLRATANHLDAWRVQEGTSAVPSLEQAFGEVPVDRWGHPLRLVIPGPGRAYDLGTLGRDGREGGAGPDADRWLSELEVR